VASRTERRQRLDGGFRFECERAGGACGGWEVRRRNQLRGVRWHRRNDGATSFAVCAGTAGTTAQPDYVPANWAPQTGFYRSVVRPHCTMCHLAAPDSWNFASWQNFQDNGPLMPADLRRRLPGAHDAACGSSVQIILAQGHGASVPAGTSRGDPRTSELLNTQ